MRAVSEALADGYAVNLTNHPRLLAELQLGTGLTDAEVARKLLVSPHTYRRWRRDRTPNPTAVRLLAIYSGYVPWPGWHGWEMRHGFVFPPGARHGLSPAQVEGLPWLLTLMRDQQRKSAAERPAEAPQQSGMPWWRPVRLWLALMALRSLAPVVAARRRRSAPASRA